MFKTDILSCIEVGKSLGRASDHGLIENQLLILISFFFPSPDPYIYLKICWPDAVDNSIQLSRIDPIVHPLDDELITFSAFE